MKTAVVTGASTGIGRAVAQELASNGFGVFLVARRRDALLETQKMIVEASGTAEIFVADLSAIDSINALLAEIKQKTAKIDLIANIAGIWHGKDEVYAGKDFRTFDQQVILDTLMVGMVAPAALVHGLLPLMGAGAKVINLSGTFENGAKGWLPYFVSKRAIEDFTVGLAQELADQDIQVNCISPSDTATAAYAKFFPQFMSDAVEPKEIAQKFVELSDVQNKKTGQVIVIKKGTEPAEHFHY